MNAKAWTYMLNRFINGGYFSSAEGIAASVTPGLVYYKNAGAVISMFEQRKEVVPAIRSERLNIQPYTGGNETIKELMQALRPLNDILEAALIHGSFATGEQIAYSDFDGLLILKDELFADRSKLAKAAKRLNDLRFYMHRLDPLQHHGWFVLSQFDFKDYREDFLPIDTLKHARSIFPDEPLQLEFKINDTTDFRKPFFRLCKGLEKKLSTGPDRYNLYGLKAIFSEFMMLAPLFIQAKTGRGVFKKFAFEQMKMYFKKEEYEVMDTVSAIRSRWDISIPEKEKRFLERTDFYSWYRRKHIHYDLPSWLKEMADEELFIRMKVLTIAARNKIESE